MMRTTHRGVLLRSPVSRGWGLALLSLFLGGSVGKVGGQESQAQLQELGWIAGSWTVTTQQGRVEEHWISPAANALLGMGRTLVEGRMVAFEYLRIEAREEGIYYVAQPNGRPPTSFRLTHWDGTTAVFENPEHDFPKRVLYTREGPDAVTARVDGGEGSPQILTFRYRRVDESGARGAGPRAPLIFPSEARD